MEVFEADGWKGGTAFLWNDKLGWEIIHRSKCIANITNGDNNNWKLWVCYCPAERSQQGEFWDTLIDLIKNGSNS